MTDSATPLDPSTGLELFREQDGERRIPWDNLIDAPTGTADAFVAELKRYMAAHPRLEVSIGDAMFTDELVVKWRWRR